MRDMRRKYDDEFRRDVVTKVLDGQSVASISREIGVSESLFDDEGRLLTQSLQTRVSKNSKCVRRY